MRPADPGRGKRKNTELQAQDNKVSEDSRVSLLTEGPARPQAAHVLEVQKGAHRQSHPCPCAWSRLPGQGTELNCHSSEGYHVHARPPFIVHTGQSELQPGREYVCAVGGWLGLRHTMSEGEGQPGFHELKIAW